MRTSVRFTVLCVFCMVFTAAVSAASIRWQAPFDRTVTRTAAPKSELTLAQALDSVAQNNPTLRALDYERRAALGGLTQAGLWPNPELEAELEEIGWDARGLSESELTVALSQEFELLGQRGARKNLAATEMDAVGFDTRVQAFDLYLEVKHRFYTLVHAQAGLELAEASVRLAGDIVDNINYRITRGAALQSELLLAQIEQERTQLALEKTRQQRAAAQARLAALWHSPSTDITVVVDTEPALDNLLQRVRTLAAGIDSTRTIMHLKHASAMTRAEHTLAAAEARPSMTLTGGIKRLESNNSKSFLFGISLPLPLFDRNQGDRETLAARMRALDHRIARERLDAQAELEAKLLALENLVQRHDTLDGRLLPLAEEAYRSLHDAYESGRVPYTQLLEAERSLNELRYEHNDMLFDLHQQIISLESLTGTTVHIDEEN